MKPAVPTRRERIEEPLAIRYYRIRYNQFKSRCFLKIYFTFEEWKYQLLIELLIRKSRVEGAPKGVSDTQQRPSHGNLERIEEIIEQRG